MALHEDAQQIERLRAERHALAASGQDVLSRAKFERAKTVHRRRAGPHLWDFFGGS
jgi:hypothetical protein